MSNGPFNEAAYLAKIGELESRLEDAENLINAIKAGEVDAFAFTKDNSHPEIFTLQGGDFAYRVLVENINEGALNLSDDQLIVYTNNSFFQLLHLPYESVIGHYIAEFIFADDMAAFQVLFKNALESESAGEIRLQAANKIVPVYISLKSLQPDLPTVAIIVTDLTARKKAENDLRVKDSLQNILRQSPAAIAILEGPSFEFGFANDQFLKLFHSDASALSGRNLEAVFPEAAERGITDLYRKAYRTGNAVVLKEVELLLQNDGSDVARFFDSVLQPIKNDQGAVSSVMTHLVEVTDQVNARRKIKQSENELNELANAVPQLVWMADADGNVLYYNDRIQEFSGAERDKDGRWKWNSLVHPDDQALTEASWSRAVADKTMYETEHRIQLKDGSYRWFLSRGYPHRGPEGNILKWYGSATDIHAQKMHEEQKDEFLKMVSHELKTPVTSIKGYVQLLLAMLQEEHGTIKELITQPLIRIDNQIGRLGKLITDILDISRLEDGKMDMQKEVFDLSELLKETVQDMLLANSSHNIIITAALPVKVMADKNRIGQVLINLVNNAVKYSPNEQRVEVSMKMTGAAMVSVSVKDNGIGIDARELKKIFQRFYQSEGSDSKNYTGFGIGLYLTAEIIQRHGGNIEVQSRKNEGAVFTFTLPVKQ